MVCQLLRLDSLDKPALNTIPADEWHAIADSAVKHSMAALFYGRMKAVPSWTGFPEDVRSELHFLHLHSSARDLARRHRLGKMLKAFHQNNLPVIVLKGAFLAENVYHDPAERPMSDTDLLFKVADLQPAIDILRSQGFQSGKEFWIEDQIQVSHEMPTFYQRGYPALELHWTLIEPKFPFRVDLEGLWARARPASVADAPVLGLDQEDLILHLCMHAATQHRLRGGLRMTYDVAASVGHYHKTIDWDTLTSRAREWNAQRAAYLMLSLAYILFGAPVPEAALENLQPEDYQPGFFDLALELIFQPVSELPAFPPRLAELQQADSSAKRVQLVLSQVFLNRQEMARRYSVRANSWKVFLYYPVRWRDLVAQRLALVWKMVRKDPQTLSNAESIGTRTSQEDTLINWLVSQG